MSSYEKLKAKYEILKEALDYLERTCNKASLIEGKIEEYDEYYKDMTPTEVYKHENKFVADVATKALLKMYSI